MAAFAAEEKEDGGADAAAPAATPWEPKVLRTPNFVATKD